MKRCAGLLVMGAMAAVVMGCQSRPAPAVPRVVDAKVEVAPPARSAAVEPATTPPASAMVEAFPGVRLDARARVVEFDAEVAANPYAQGGKATFLETIVCTPDTREHEALLVTRVRPSHVHAALLALGLEPGSPGSWKMEGERVVPVPPRGPGVDVRFVYERDGERREESPARWVRHAGMGRTLAEAAPGDGFVFAGSAILRRQGVEAYDADGTGQLIGLHVFGSETLAWSVPMNPEASAEEPVWIAGENVPPARTKVVVRLAPVPSGKGPGEGLETK